MALSTSTLLFALFSLGLSQSQPFLPSRRDLLACEPLCISCDSSAKCLSCTYHAHLSAGKCACDGGYYLDEIYCEVCPAACATCSKSDALKCTECSDLAELSENGDCSCIGGSSWNIYTRTCECPSGSYFSVTQMCLLCSSHCVVCEGPGTAQCIVCESGLFPSSNGCISRTFTSNEIPDDEGGTDIGGAIGGAIGGVVSLVIVGGCAYYWWNRCKGTIVGALIISS